LQIDGEIPMPTEFKKLDNEPIVVVTLPKDYDLAAELPVQLPKYISMLDAAPEPVYWIVDARNSSLGVEEIITGASLVASGKHPLYHHPNIRQVIYVTSSRIMKLAAEGLQSESFGHIAIKLFDDLDEALKYTRANK
jgi:hypothetical protein